MRNVTGFFVRCAQRWWVLQVGWKHEKAVAELEAKRKVQSAEYFKTKKKLAAIRARAEAQAASS